MQYILTIENPADAEAVLALLAKMPGVEVAPADDEDMDFWDTLPPEVQARIDDAIAAMERGDESQFVSSEEVMADARAILGHDSNT